MIRDDSRVVMHVTIRADGEIIHSTTGTPPLDYVLGSGGLVPGLDAALVGMRAGESKQSTVVAEKAFGLRDPDAVERVPRSAFNPAEPLAIGDIVRASVVNRPFTAVVLAIAENEVTLDVNHPLAGKLIEFEVEVLEIL